MADKKTPLRIALADDHILLRNALASLINSFGDCQVVCEADNGQELCAFLSTHPLPDLVIMDLNMPEMDGFRAAGLLNKKWPEMPVLMLTMYDSEFSLIRLLQNGVRGFLKKDVHPDELKFAIRSVIQTGYYYSHHISGKLANLFRPQADRRSGIDHTMLSEQEARFMELACTEMTYKEIAMHMHLNPRAIDNLRDQLFEKLDVRSRVGLAMITIRNGLARF